MTRNPQQITPLHFRWHMALACALRERRISYDPIWLSEGLNRLFNRAPASVHKDIDPTSEMFFWQIGSLTRFLHGVDSDVFFSISLDFAQRQLDEICAQEPKWSTRAFRQIVDELEKTPTLVVVHEP